MAKQRTNMAAKPVSIAEPPHESALADTKHENQQKLAAFAYEFWQARGFPAGTSEEDWFRAKQEIARRPERNKNRRRAFTHAFA